MRSYKTREERNGFTLFEKAYGLTTAVTSIPFAMGSAEMVAAWWAAVVGIGLVTGARRLWRFKTWGKEDVPVISSKVAKEVEALRALRRESQRLADALGSPVEATDALRESEKLETALIEEAASLRAGPGANLFARPLVQMTQLRDLLLAEVKQRKEDLKAMMPKEEAASIAVSQEVTLKAPPKVSEAKIIDERFSDSVTGLKERLKSDKVGRDELKGLISPM